MAKQRKSKSQDKPDTVPHDPVSSRSLHVLKTIAIALVLPALAAAYSRVSLLALAPVYGSTPSRLWHDVICNIAVLSGSLLPESIQKIETITPALALSAPIFQRYLFQYSSLFGNPAGPVLTEMITIFPLLLFSISSYLRRIGRLNLSQTYPLLIQFIFSVSGIIVFRLADILFQPLLAAYIGSNVLMTTFGIQFAIASLYTALFSSYISWAFLVLPTAYLLVTADLNTPFVQTAARVNSTLHGIGYSLVDRQESLTGYISVLDNIDIGYRAMRCDHSLLGGEWIHRPSHYNPRVSDPIYAVFTMLEAVRLVESEPGLTRKEDQDTNALVMYEALITSLKY